jgi:hypothetical protein
LEEAEYIQVLMEDLLRGEHVRFVLTVCSVGWWLMADGWCWFALREEYC